MPLLGWDDFPCALAVLMLMMLMMMMALLYVEVPSSSLVRFLASASLLGQGHARALDPPGPPLPAGLSSYSLLPYLVNHKLAAVIKHDAHALTLPNLDLTFLTSKTHWSKDCRVVHAPILSGVKRA